MKILKLIQLISISFFLTIFPTQNASASEDRNLDPNEVERSFYSFQSYQGDKWYFDAIDTPNQNESGANVTIAILDSGVTKTSKLSCHNFVNEYDAFWNISGPGSARDIGSHGTLVAHTIADCDIGIAKSVNIMPVRVFTDYFSQYGIPTYTDDLAVAMGIVWAVDNGADIINMSFGASCYTTWEGGCKGETGNFAGYVDGAIKYAYDNNVLLLAASGNDALPWVSYPANNPYVWAIGAVNSSLNKASFSNFGTALDFVAPGENIGTALGAVDGTSFSSPEVSAAAAILKGSMPGLSIKEMEDAFICTVVDLGDAGWDPQHGWGVIQINASLDLLNAGLLQTPWFPSPNLTLVSEGQGKIKAMWQAADDCNGIDSYSLYSENIMTNFYDKSQTEGYVTVSESGKYKISVLATNVFGNKTNLISASIKIDLTPPKWNDDETITISSKEDNLVYSWPAAEDDSGISYYSLRVEKDKQLVLQENTNSTSITVNLANFTDPGTYTVNLRAFDKFNNFNELKTGFIIENTVTDQTSTTSTLPNKETTTTTIPVFETTSTTSSTSTTTTTTIVSETSTPTGTLTGDCPILSSETAATSPLFKQVNNNLFPFGPTESAFSGYEGCMYSGLDKDQIKRELVRYLNYWKEFDKDEFKNLESVKSRNWRNDDALNAAADRWSAEWSGINPSSIVENLSRSDGQLVWDDSYWTVGLTTTTLATISDPTTENTVLGAPTITGTSLSGSTLTVFFDHAPAVKDLEIVAYGCSYYTETNGPAGGVDGFEVSSKTCVIDIPTNYPTVYVKVHAKYGNYVNCGQANETCVQIDNAQWGPYTDWYEVTIFTPTTTTTTTTVPQNSSESNDSSTTTTSTTTTLPPSNTTTTTVACKSLDEAKSLVLQNWSGTKRCAGCVPGSKYWVIDPAGNTTALVDGVTQNVSYIDLPSDLQAGDTFLQGISWEGGLEFYTHTVENPRSSGNTALYTMVHSDAYIEREARNNYIICE